MWSVCQTETRPALPRSRLSSVGQHWSHDAGSLPTNDIFEWCGGFQNPFGDGAILWWRAECCLQMKMDRNTEKFELRQNSEQWHGEMMKALHWCWRHKAAIGYLLLASMTNNDETPLVWTALLAGTSERKMGEGNEKRRFLHGLNDPMTRNNIYWSDIPIIYLIYRSNSTK